MGETEKAISLMKRFMRLPPEEQQNFLNSLTIWLDIHLPDGDRLMISKREYARLLGASRLISEEKLYDIAKEVTLEAGMPWTDPRTGETFKP